MPNTDIHDCTFGSVASDAGDQLAQDILRGAEAIAIELFGSKKERRRVYHLASSGQLPVFHLGAIVCARRSTLRRWIEEQESTAKRSA